MERTLIGLVVGAVLLGLVMFGRSGRQSSAGTEYLEASMEMVTYVDGYETRPEYYRWLVEVCHEDAFDGAYVREGSRRRDRSYVDEEKYFYNLLTSMMRQAGADKVEHVSIALQKFRDDQLNDPEERRPRRPPSLAPR